jgi:hypothetical protein
MVDGETAETVEAALVDLEPRLRRSVAEPGFGALHFRRQVDTLVRALQVACLGASAAAALHARRHLVLGYDPERDAEYPVLIERALTES